MFLPGLGRGANDLIPGRAVDLEYQFAIRLGVGDRGLPFGLRLHPRELISNPRDAVTREQPRLPGRAAFLYGRDDESSDLSRRVELPLESRPR